MISLQWKKENASLEHFSLESKLADFPKLIKFQQQKDITLLLFLSSLSSLLFQSAFCLPFSTHTDSQTPLSHKHSKRSLTQRHPDSDTMAHLSQGQPQLTYTSGSWTSMVHKHSWLTENASSQTYLLALLRSIMSNYFITFENFK